MPVRAGAVHREVLAGADSPSVLSEPSSAGPRSDGCVSSKGGEPSEVFSSAKGSVTLLAAAKAAVGKSDTAMTSASIRVKNLLHIVVYLPSNG